MKVEFKDLIIELSAMYGSTSKFRAEYKISKYRYKKWLKSGQIEVKYARLIAEKTNNMFRYLNLRGIR